MSFMRNVQFWDGNFLKSHNAFVLEPARFLKKLYGFIYTLCFPRFIFAFNTGETCYFVIRTSPRKARGEHVNWTLRSMSSFSRLYSST